jgi:hypothetical protein
MRLNKAKSGILVIRIDKRTKKYSKQQICGIDVVESYKYLGVQISDTVRFRKLAQDQKAPLYKNISLIKKMVHRIPDRALQW